MSELSTPKIHMNCFEEVHSLSSAVTRFVEAPGLVRWDLKKNEAVEIMADVGVIPLELTPVDESSLEGTYARTPRQPVMQWPNKTRRNFSPGSISALRGDCSSFPILKTRRRPSNSVDYFSIISDEVVLSIFKWLPKETLAVCARVCKRWRTLCYDESLWKRLDLGKRCLHAGILGMIVQRGVVALRLSMAEIESPIFLSSYSLSERSCQRFSKLQYLDLSTASISEESLSQLLSVCSQLKKLSLECCRLNEDICSHLTVNKNLEELNMSMCQGLTCASIVGISVSCSKLKSWNLAWTGLSAECINVLTQSIPASVTRLNLSGQRDSFVDDNLLQIVKRCRNLVELDVSDCSCLTNAAIDYIVTYLKNLEHLHISRCYNIDWHKYISLVSLKNFSHLEIFSILSESRLSSLQTLMPEVKINKGIFSTIARPTTGSKRTSIWGVKVRDRL